MMGIEREVVQRRPKYRATVTADGTAAVAHVEGDSVEFRMPEQRAILRVPVKQWEAFEYLVGLLGDALKEKAAIESAHLEFPWDTQARDTDTAEVRRIGA